MELHLHKIEEPVFDLNTFRTRFINKCFEYHGIEEENCQVVQEPGEFERILSEMDVKQDHYIHHSCVDSGKIPVKNRTVSVHYTRTNEDKRRAVSLYGYNIPHKECYLQKIIRLG